MKFWLRIKDYFRSAPAGFTC